MPADRETTGVRGVLRSTPPPYNMDQLIRKLERLTTGLRRLQSEWRKPRYISLDLTPYEDWIFGGCILLILWIAMLWWVPTIVLWLT